MLNFANSIQAACGCEVSATQFLQAESCSAMAFQAAAVDSLQCGNSAALEVGHEAAARESAADSLSPKVFEGLVSEFLRGVWLDNQDPTDLLKITITDDLTVIF